MAKKMWTGLLAAVAAFGLVLASCDNGTTGGGGSGGGGDGWSSWYSVTLPSGTGTAQFMWHMVGPQPPQGSEVKVEVEGATPTSFTLSASSPNNWVTPQDGSTFRFRYQQDGGRGHSGTSIINFLW